MAKLIKKEDNRATIEFVISKEEFQKGITLAYNKTKHKFSIPGFRKGKAPRKVIENNYGVGIFYEDAVNELLPDAYEKAIDELKLDVVSRPDIDIKEFDVDKDLVIEAKVDLMPIAELPDCDGLECEVEYADFDESVLDKIIDSEREKNARLVPVERAAENGDTVVIDFLGKVDGEEFEGGNAKNHNLVLGSNSFIPGFEDQIVGKSEGDEFDVNVEFPQDYHHEALAGKPAVFEVKLHEVKVKELPEFDDELVEDISEYETVAEYKENTLKRAKENWEKGLESAKSNGALKTLVDSTVVDIPNSMIEMEIDEAMKDLDYRFRMQGFSLEQYMELTQMDKNAMRDQLRDNAESSAKTKIVINALVEKYNPEISDEEMDKEIEIASKQTGQKFEDLKEIYNNENAKNSLIKHLKSKKSIDELVKLAKITVVEPKLVDNVNAEKVIDAVMDQVEDEE